MGFFISALLSQTLVSCKYALPWEDNKADMKKKCNNNMHICV